MANNYYEELLENLKALMQQQEYQKAYDLVVEELRMPYVPAHVLCELESLEVELEQQLQVEKKLPLLTVEEIQKALKGKPDEVYQALDSLGKSNIRNYLEPIQEYLINPQSDRLVVSLLLELCMQQQVSTPLTYIHQATRYTVIPSEMRAPLADDTLQQAWQYMGELFENHNPSFLQQCRQVLIQYAYLEYPQSIVDDYLTISYRIVKYMYKLYDDIEGWNKFALAKGIDSSRIEDIVI